MQALDATPPAPAASSGAQTLRRDIDAVTYAGDPEKRRLTFDARRLAARPGARQTLTVAGHEGLEPVEGVRCAGRLSRTEFRLLLRRAKVFVAAPRREEFGIAALEALAEGCMLVTTPSPGPYPALDLARALDARLVGDDLAAAIRLALDAPLPVRGAGGPSCSRRSEVPRSIGPSQRRAAAVAGRMGRRSAHRELPRLHPEPVANGFYVGPLFFHAYGSCTCSP